MPYHKDLRKIKYRIGDVLEVHTFAGPIIHQRVKKTFDYKTKIGGEEINVRGFEGSFVRRKDLYALKKSCVPYSGDEKLSKCISFTYDNQIIKIIKRKN
jgi:hypothetical protein